MDSNILEFWGNMLIQTAKNRKNYEDMFGWMSKSIAGFEDFMSSIGKSTKEKSNDEIKDYMNTLASTAEHFQNSYSEYLNMMGVINKSDHLKLIEKYEILKEKVAAQEETIRHLKMLLSEKIPNQGEVIQTFQELVRNQGDQFQEFMNNVKNFYKSSNAPSNEPAQTPPKSEQ